MVDVENKQLAKTDVKIGVDVGLKEFAITSNGDKYENPKWLRKSEKRLAKLQKSLSRKKLGSNNRKKLDCKLLNFTKGLQTKGMIFCIN